MAEAQARKQAAPFAAARAKLQKLVDELGRDVAIQCFAESLQAHAYAEGRKDEAAKWTRVGFIGLDAALILANTKATITTTITKEPLFADGVELWALWMKT